MNKISVSSSLAQHLSKGDDPGFSFVDWKGEIVFGRSADIPEILILDLDLPESLDITCGLREHFNSDFLPIYGFASRGNTKIQNLFFACGGTGILSSPAEIPGEKEEKSGGRKGEFSFPIRIGLSQNETVRRLLDNLETQTIRKEITSIQKRTEVLSKTVELLLENLRRTAKIHIAVILINNNQSIESYVLPSRGIFREDYLDFLNFCLNDFFTHFQGFNMENPREILFIENPEEFNKLKIGTKKISSYFYLPLKNSKDEIIGTIHLGHLSNNFFQGNIPASISQFVKRMEPSLYFALKSSQNTVRQEKIFSIFSKFVPPEIIPDLISQELDRKKQPVHKRTISVLFSDIRSFTTITEKNNPQKVVDFLNRHFDAMVSIIKKYGGTIDKFIGDAIVAVFGLTGESADTPVHAVRAAMEMTARVKTVDCSGLVLPGEHYAIGIGVHYGEAIIGNIGSPEKSAFTAIGDVIGRAEELEGITKKYREPILVSGEVFGEVRETIPMETVLGKGREAEWPEGLYTPATAKGDSKGG